MKTPKFLLCLCIAIVVLGNNSCKKGEKTFSPASNSATLSLIANLPANQQIKPKELLDWFAGYPPLKDVQPQWSNATQTVYNGKHVVEVPVTPISALFFTKVKGVLNIDIYKWYDKKPGDKVFTGNITVISLQDYKLSAYKYIDGQLQNSGYISLLNPAQPSGSFANQVQSSSVNNGSNTLHTSLTTPKQRKSIANFLIDLGCWISGGRVIEGAVDGCVWGEGSIYSDAANFFSSIFGGGGGSADNGSTYGSYGAGSVGYTSSDGSSVSYSAGSGGMAYLTINNPCNTAPPPWYNGGGSAPLAVRGPKTLVAQPLPNPCGINYTSTQWVPIPVVTNYVPLPCPGDIVVNPQIARSNAVNINGGRFGLTRIDPKTHLPKMHKGLDILAQPNTTIYAAYGGVVKRAISIYPSTYYGGPRSFGNLIEIQSTLPDGTVISMLYGHLNSVDGSVYPGGTVKQGQIIGLSGRTGNAKKGFSPHVHIQVVVNGIKVDPEPFMATKFDSAGQSTGSPCAP